MNLSKITSICSAFFLLFASLVGPGCGNSSENLLLEIRKGETYSIIEMGKHLSEVESGGGEFSQGDLAAIDLLEEIVKTDPIVTNRMRAVAALATLKKVNNTEIFIQCVHSDYWGVRWEGAKALAARPNPAAVPALIWMLKNEKEDIILLDVVKALAATGDEASLVGLFTVYFDLTPRHKNNRMKAHEAISRITGKSFPFEDVQTWVDYSKERSVKGEQGSPEKKE
jgi:hypothetical protein